MKRKTIRLLLSLFISLFVICYQTVRAELDNNFINMISSIKNQTYAKAPLKMTFDGIFSYDLNFLLHKKYCKNVSFPFSVQLKNEKLTCMSKDKYMLKIDNDIYTYIYDPADSYLVLVTKSSGSNYPITYNSYSFPEGDLKSVVVIVTPEESLIFDSDGQLIRFSSPKMCVEEDHRTLVESENNFQMCNKLLIDDEYELNFEKD